MTALWVIVLCGALSIVYAIWATASVLKADAGNPRMQEIAAAVREGAQAYLRRQYTTIAIVGVVPFISHIAAWPLVFCHKMSEVPLPVKSSGAGWLEIGRKAKSVGFRPVESAPAATTSLVPATVPLVTQSCRWPLLS